MAGWPGVALGKTQERARSQDGSGGCVTQASCIAGRGLFVLLSHTAAKATSSARYSRNAHVQHKLRQLKPNTTEYSVLACAFYCSIIYCWHSCLFVSLSLSSHSLCMFWVMVVLLVVLVPLRRARTASGTRCRSNKLIEVQSGEATFGPPPSPPPLPVRLESSTCKPATTNPARERKWIITLNIAYCERVVAQTRVLYATVESSSLAAHLSVWMSSSARMSRISFRGVVVHIVE